eukprot:TRINITY_DN4006_c0_g1_i1.p1 TRINITY_DN4006_c0_g1~~TRINITY_DN4006_c0_g1_i1.p1  ORF type:complete len:275 (+),score=67.81 TRINITY_DN4006_c0_g1_i1:93-917(+)
MSCCPPGAVGYLEPQGENGTKATAGGFEVYESGEFGKPMLLLLPDIWGWNGGRIRSLADNFAKNGYFVAIAKLMPAFEGGTDDDALPPFFEMSRVKECVFPLFMGEWAVEKVVPKVQKVLEHYASKGVEKVSLYGFCYGGWVGMHLAASKTAIPIVCAASSHPSIHIEGLLGKDPSALASKQSCPWLFQPTGVLGAEGADPDMYDAGGILMKALEELHPGKNQSTRYAAQPHGFVTRGAITNGTVIGSNDNTKSDIEKAVTEVLAFMEKSGAKC